MIYVKMCQLQKNNLINLRFIKYKCEYLFTVFNLLYIKKKFENISLKNFLYKQIKLSQKKRRILIDLNIDFNKKIKKSSLSFKIFNEENDLKDFCD